MHQITQAVNLKMKLIYALVMAALDLAGIVFNIRMLQSCFKDKTKYTFLQKCRTLTICQCACQGIILVADAVESWKGFEIQPREACNVFIILMCSTLFFQVCNLLAILVIYFDHPVGQGNLELSSKLKISAALSLGFIGCVVIWWCSCFSQDFFSQMAITVLFVVAVAFVVLLFPADARKIIQDPLDDAATPETSTKTYSLLCKVYKEQRQVFFIILLLVCLVVIISGSPHSAETEGFKEMFFYSIVTRFVVGIILPVTFSDLIELSQKEENGMKIEVI